MRAYFWPRSIMKRFLVTVAFLSAVCASAANLVLPIRAVVDGDTISSTLALPCPLCNVSIRILGIDTPETSYLAKCPAEKAKGLEAKAFVKTLVGKETTMTVKNVKWDKYGGRIDGIVVIANVDVGAELLKNSLARPYTGIGPKSDWCS
jgi:endonuclease YncB( thermonuclease family)